MFSIGLPEIAIIFLVLVIFIKPEDIPTVFQTLGRWYGNLRRLYMGVTDEFRDISYELDLKNASNTQHTQRSKSSQPKEASDDLDEMNPIAFRGNSNKL